MTNLTRDFEPTIILHHPHSTDSPRIWTTAWSGAREFLPKSDPRRHVWASGIGYYNDDGDGETRGALCAVQSATRCCGSHVVDIAVEPRAESTRTRARFASIYDLLDRGRAPATAAHVSEFFEALAGGSPDEEA